MIYYFLIIPHECSDRRAQASLLFSCGTNCLLMFGVQVTLFKALSVWPYLKLGYQLRGRSGWFALAIESLVDWAVSAITRSLLAMLKPNQSWSAGDRLKPGLAVMAPVCFPKLCCHSFILPGFPLLQAGTSVSPALIDQLPSEPPNNVSFLFSLLWAPDWSSSPSLLKRWVFLGGRYSSGGKSSCPAVGGLPVWTHPGRVKVSLSKTPNPQLRDGWYLAWQPIAVGVWMCVWMGGWET